MDTFDHVFEQFKVHGKDLVEKVRELLHEGNVRRIIVKDEAGHTFMEIPLTVAAVGVIAAPLLAALGAIATVVGNFEITVERGGKAKAAGSHPQASSTVTDQSVGAKESQMDMRDTVPEHSDNKGTKLEDIAGTGEHDSLGG